MHVIAALKFAFSLWMFIDAIKRRAPWWWCLVVWFPFGAWAYFFLVKLGDFESTARRLLTQSTSLSELERNARTTPSIDNKVALAQKLHDTRDYRRAGELFAQVLAQSSGDKESRYGLALCLLRSEETSDVEEARRHLERLVEGDFGFRDFEPVYDLADVYWRAGRRHEALDLLRRVCRRTTLLQPRVRLARGLIETGDPTEACRLLEEALAEYRDSPGFVRRRDRNWAGDARRVLRQARRERAMADGSHPAMTRERGGEPRSDRQVGPQ